MIAAALANGTLVEVESALFGQAHVTSLDGSNIGQSYIGGIGYTGVPFTTVDPDDLAAVVNLDPDDCDELANWQEAMRAVDALAENHSPDLMAAVVLENQARQAVIDYIHTHSLPRPNPAREIAPNSPHNAPSEIFYGGGADEDLQTQRGRLQGPRGDQRGGREDGISTQVGA